MVCAFVIVRVSKCCLLEVEVFNFATARPRLSGEPGCPETPATIAQASSANHFLRNSPIFCDFLFYLNRSLFYT